MNPALAAWVLLVVPTATGCAASHDTAPADAAPAPARTAAAVPQRTLVVTSVVGGPRFRAPSSSALWPSRPCQAWNVSSVSYGSSVVTEHVLVGPEDGTRLLAAVRRVRAVRSAHLAGPEAYDRVPPPEHGFEVSAAYACPS